MFDIFIPGQRVTINAPTLPETGLTSVFIGNKPDHYLIVDQPSTSNVIENFKEGDHCSLAIIDEMGRHYNFDVEFLKVLTDPVNAYCFKYPDRLNSQRQRAADRHTLRIEAFFSKEMQFGDIDKCEQGMLLNISRSGSLLQSPIPYEPHDILYLTFAIPMEVHAHDNLAIVFDELNMVTDLESLVRHVTEDGEEYHLGVEFAINQSDAFLGMRRFVETLDALQTGIRIEQGTSDKKPEGAFFRTPA